MQCFGDVPLLTQVMLLTLTTENTQATLTPHMDATNCNCTAMCKILLSYSDMYKLIAHFGSSMSS